ncbi:Rrf2 family transcriptional regulator, nitric oxide-sensitive transcriptional repressor [Evansella caseinilytica]|uniref:HTH-type transcriptional regulator NsrR n=1 Tax=Evansella caseinilytica TaxID=1503961 RepID=A0A1H3IEC3_9BACI|nr:Rrf2 family transcriptional regulator [Evansella caseinilytica]SDY25448.1 Rrf2 family transcriptional regulator, nitric oxide-sensitive transcriptional repressor [Evansella caseinilytica]
MQLTIYTDYALRVLIYLGAQPVGKLSNIREIAGCYNISYNHLSKVVYELGKFGLIETIRGRNGGIRLSKDPGQINIGRVVRYTESPLAIVECFDDTRNTCKISSACRLKGILNEALHAYLEVLDNYTLEDLLVNKETLNELLK